MSNLNLLDDGIFSQQLDKDSILIQSKKIGQRVLILSLFFAFFAVLCIPVTMEALQKYKSYSSSYSNLYYLYAAISTQFGTVFLAVRLFLYQRSILKNQDWLQVFETKYKVWRALAAIFIITLSSIAILVLEANQIFW